MGGSKPAGTNGESATGRRYRQRPHRTQRLGDQRGRTIGFPTANVALGEHLRPRFGVYAVRALVDGAWRNGVANLGKRPTFGKQQENFEVHLFDFAGDLYGKVLRVALVDFIRAEMKFAGLDALKAQICRDAETARAWFAQHPV